MLYSSQLSFSVKRGTVHHRTRLGPYRAVFGTNPNTLTSTHQASKSDQFICFHHMTHWTVGRSSDFQIQSHYNLGLKQGKWAHSFNLLVSKVLVQMCHSVPRLLKCV